MTAPRIVPRKGDPDPTAVDVAGDGVIIRATWLVAP